MSARGGRVALAAVVLASGTVRGQSTARDEYQRSAEIYEMKTTAKAGAQRGEELYYYKCWYCHNEYAKTAPLLRGLYDRGYLMSSKPVNDENVAEKIRKGGPLMPAYGYTLSEADMDDLLSYIRDKKCCFEGAEPPPNPRYRGATDAETGRALSGGPHGSVRGPKGAPLEGIGVQLVSRRSAIRTTVYTNAGGRYEFPPLQGGVYELRIARPLEYKPFLREGVKVEGATAIEDIVLERVSETEFLPPTREVLAQLTGADWLLNLPSDGRQKRVFTLSCGFGCHSYQQIFRNRYDEAGWRRIVERMTRGAGSPLINIREVTARTRGRSGLPLPEEEEIVVKWLASVRGPEAKDPPLHHLPRPRGASTRVVVTEYELPRMLLAPHDVHGDSKGQIWYTPHRSPYVGKLDPRTGVVKEYRVPDTAGALPGTHRVWVDDSDIVWLSENWAHNLTRLDPKTGQFKQIHIETDNPVNSPGFSNFHIDPEGYVWETEFKNVVRIDPATGSFVRKFPFTRLNSTYDNILSVDGRYWAGGQTGTGIVGLLDTTSGQLWELDTPTPISSASRGGFDRQGNAWLGGRGGMLIKLDPRTRHISEYYPPVPNVTFYEALPDKNGEVWAAALHGGRMLRFNPRTERWTEYLLPEPYSHDRRTWIDNSTDPVTVWYVDHNGYMVRVQPTE
jgi:streptogramin lyase/mono/diheme cytochrome c family protein